MSVSLDLPHPARYFLACHSHSRSSKTTESLYVEVTKPRPHSASGPDLLSLTNSSFGPTSIWAKGDVISANNTVTCSLTPIDCVTGESNGSPQSPAILKVTANAGGGQHGELRSLRDRSVDAICWRPRRQMKEAFP
jgi:hypothetical protein